MTLLPYDDACVLETRSVRVVVSPRLGGAILRYDVASPQGLMPIFRPTPETAENAFDCAMIILAPWSNRVSGGGFVFEGVFHALPVNWPGEKYPLHGNAFQRRWQVSEQGEDRISLVLESDGPGPFRYAAEVRYRLDDAALVSSLFIVNRAERRLPYGGGFHPWFVRDPDTSLRARARSVWLENDAHLPIAGVALDQRPDLDFSAARSLPDLWINNCFEGWNGDAQIAWPNRDIVLDVKADPPLTFLHVYAPDKATKFFCVEPTSHAVGAHNRSLLQASEGLAALAPGESINLRSRFSPGRFQATPNVKSDNG